VKTKQALFLVALNIILPMVAIRWFNESARQLGQMIAYVSAGGGWGGQRWSGSGVWSITMFEPRELITYADRFEPSAVAAHFTNYPAILFFIMAGINVLLILVFLVWNNFVKQE